MGSPGSKCSAEIGILSYYDKVHVEVEAVIRRTDYFLLTDM